MSAIQQVLAAVGGVVVFSTWNPLDKAPGVPLTNGNLTAAGVSTTFVGVRGTKSKSSGTGYFEVTITTVYINAGDIGIAATGWNELSALGLYDSVSASAHIQASVHLCANTNATNIPLALYPTAGDVVGVAVDITNHLIYWSYNGTWLNSAVPSSGIGGIDYVTTSPVFPAWAADRAAISGTLNVGDSAFSHTPPSGFPAWQ